jgi:hypothetical protein
VRRVDRGWLVMKPNLYSAATELYERQRAAQNTPNVAFYPVAGAKDKQPATKKPDVTFRPYAVLWGTSKARYVVAAHPGKDSQPALYVDEADAQKLADQLNGDK